MVIGERILAFGGIHNFRDYGGYATSGGGRLKSGLLYRSGEHKAATDADLEAVDRLGLAGVIDLRGGSERDQSPCRRSANFSAEVLFEIEDTAGLAPHVAAARRVEGPAGAMQGMVKGYGDIPFRPQLVRIMSRYFEALERIDGPTLIHCAAGKDRTGVSVALFHHLAGVHYDDILADYMLTNVEGRLEERIAIAAKMMREKLGEDVPDAVVRAMMSVDPSYLDAAFAAIAERHGSVDAYLRDVLGVTDARRDAIRAKLIA